MPRPKSSSATAARMMERQFARLEEISAQRLFTKEEAQLFELLVRADRMNSSERLKQSTAHDLSRGDVNESKLLEELRDKQLFPKRGPRGPRENVSTSKGEEVAP